MDLFPPQDLETAFPQNFSFLPEMLNDRLLVHKRPRAAEGDHPSRQQPPDHIWVQVFPREVQGLPEGLVKAGKEGAQLSEPGGTGRQRPWTLSLTRPMRPLNPWEHTL